MTRSARSKKEVEAITAGLGVGVSVWDALLKKGQKMGLDGEAFYFLATSEGDEALNEFIEVVLRYQSPGLAVPFTDAEALDRWASEIDGFKDISEGYREFASEVLGLGTEVKIVWEVPHGFTIWHAPKFGPCYNGFEYMKDWSVPDEATRHSLTFLAPRLVPESTRKNVKEQMEILAGYRNHFGLPGHHLSHYGTVPLLANLILSHRKYAKEMIPLERQWARTDSRLPDGCRLGLGGFDSVGLFCVHWGWDEARSSCLGCFALGVEELGD